MNLGTAFGVRPPKVGALRRNDLLKYLIERFPIVIRLNLSREFPKAFVLCLIFNLSAQRLIRRLSLRLCRYHRTEAKAVAAPYMALPARAV
jgi:hypothetical protein